MCDICGAFICRECGSVVRGERVLCKRCIGREYVPAEWEKRFAGGGLIGFFKTDPQQ